MKLRNSTFSDRPGAHLALNECGSPFSTAVSTSMRLRNYTTCTDTIIVTKVERDGYTNILFLNPYGNEHRLSLYQAVRRANIPYWVHDRGALPHSWFFDPAGFNADSDSYGRSKWDHALSDIEEERVVSYIRTIKASAETLEKNGPPRSAEHWRSSLGIGDRKVLFVPLQRPRDTVARFFGGAVGPYENFYYWVSRVAGDLDPAQWVVVVKKHPAEQERPNIPGVTFAPDNAHIHDMIDLADTVMLLNSGVGVLSLAFGKPVVACGEAFYTTAGLAAQASSPEDALSKIIGGTGYDQDTARRFVHYLATELYSFGIATYTEREIGNERFLAATKIVYRSIRMLTEEPVILGGPTPEANLDSPLFATFGGKDAMEIARKKHSDKAKKAGAMLPSEKPQIVVKPVALHRRPLVPIVRPFVSAIGTKKDVEKFSADPAGFFAGLSNPRYRAIGRVLFPTRTR